MDVDCGAGFYVRALARDLGAALGTRAHLESLVRTRVGHLDLGDAIGLEDAVALGANLALGPCAVAVEGWSTVVPVGSGVDDLRQGRALPAPGATPGPAYATDAGGRVLAIGEVRDAQFHPKRLVEL